MFVYVCETTESGVDKIEAAFRIEAKDTLRKISDSVTYLKKQLVDRKLLALTDANQINPNFDVRVFDRRKVQMPPLPAVIWVLETEERQR